MGAVAAAILYVENDPIRQIKLSCTNTIKAIGEVRLVVKFEAVQYQLSSRVPNFCNRDASLG